MKLSVFAGLTPAPVHTTLLMLASSAFLTMDLMNDRQADGCIMIADQRMADLKIISRLGDTDSYPNYAISETLPERQAKCA